MIKKKVLYILLTVSVLAVGGVGLYLYLQKPIATNFEECMRIKGSRVLESYPRQCETPDGKIFVEEVEVTYGEGFDGVLEFEEGIYYSKAVVEEETKEEVFNFLKELVRDGVSIEKAWYFEPKSSCGQMQVMVPSRIVIKMKVLPEGTLQGFTKISESETISQCANQSGWYFEQFGD